MTEVVDVSGELDGALRRRVAALIADGELVVAPTDTVYGVLANPFHPDGPERLHAARGTTRAVPLPVLVATTGQVPAIADVGEQPRRLMDAFWPGPLTLLLPATQGMAWDLGESRGTVAVRRPDEPLLLAILADTGPLACTAAATAGSPAPTTAEAARAELGDAVALYLDAGPRDGGPSTVVDASRGGAEVRRLGPVSADDVFRVASEPTPAIGGGPETPEEPEPPHAPERPDGAAGGVA